MIAFIFVIMLAIALVALVRSLAVLLGESSLLGRESSSAYECGFEVNGLARLPLSIRYFSLTLLFLLFDLEIVLILFLPPMFLASSPILSLVILSSVFTVLVGGLVYEWVDGSLDWVA